MFCRHSCMIAYLAARDTCTAPAGLSAPCYLSCKDISTKLSLKRLVTLRTCSMLNRASAFRGSVLVPVRKFYAIFR